MENWNLSALSIIYEEEENFEKYLSETKNLISNLKDNGFVNLVNTDAFLEEMEERYEANDNYLENIFFFFAIKGEGDTKVDVLKKISEKLLAFFDFYLPQDDEYVTQEFYSGSFEEGYYNGDEDCVMTEVINEEVNDIVKKNFNILKSDGLDQLKQTLGENPKNSLNEVEESKLPNWKKIKNAMESFGPMYAAEYGEIMEFCNEKYGEVKKSTFRTYIISCTVNHNSRIHYSPNKKERSELIDNDVLFQVEEGLVTLYDPKKHGLWVISKDQNGKLFSHKSD
tara:strand:+ start:734 stop:1579 length:846 start_codon:yes stop_codon:yes gene_type:complete